MDDFEKNNLPGIVDRVFAERMKEPRFAFVVEMAREFHRVDSTMRGTEAIRYANECLGNFLRDEGVQFGDTAYAWDKGAAIDLAREEIQHWRDA
jgi:hypothetical protein